MRLRVLVYGQIAKVATAAGAARVELEMPTADGLFRVDVSCLWPVPEFLQPLLLSDSSRTILGDEKQGFVRMCFECDGKYGPCSPLAEKHECVLFEEECTDFPFWQS
eukprot:379534-Pelagomonas_calceolata.AAC.1